MNKHYRIVFSIPVHEKTEVVIDQVINILHFNPECCVVLHISQGFVFDSEYISEQDFFRIIKGMDSVIVNPDRLRSGFEDIIQCHISNFNYAYKILDFDYICFVASNELFIKPGLWEDIKQYDCGPKRDNEVKKETRGIQEKHALEDKEFINALNRSGITKIYSGQFEGSFMRTAMMLHVCKFIESFYDYKSMNIKYTGEEIFCPTFAAAFYPDACFRNDNTTYMNWKNDLRVSVADVMNLLKFETKKYSVKRVPRFYNDEVRAFIREYVGCYKKEMDELCEIDCSINGDSSLMAVAKKNEDKKNIYRKWLSAYLNGAQVSEYLQKRDIQTVSIYGYGEIGRLLYEDLKRSRAVAVESVMDQGNADETGTVRIVEPFTKLKKTEMLIVTVLDDAGLMKRLDNYYSIPCVGFNELIDYVR